MLHRTPSDKINTRQICRLCSPSITVANFSNAQKPPIVRLPSLFVAKKEEEKEDPYVRLVLVARETSLEEWREERGSQSLRYSL